MAVRHHAICGVVVQTALDVLGHVLGIELVDIHHRAGSEASGRSIVEILLHIENTDTQLLKPCFVDKSFQHIAAYTVGLPRKHIAELPFCGIGHHTLKIHPLVCATGNGTVGIGVDDPDAILRRQLIAFLKLLFNADVFLVVAAVPTVENAWLFDFQLLAPLRLRRVLCRFSRQQRHPPSNDRFAVVDIQNQKQNTDTVSDTDTGTETVRARSRAHARAHARYHYGIP